MWQLLYRGRIVDFAISTYYEYEGTRHTIARIDCCWGMVHRHQFDKNGRDVLDHQLMHQIVLDGTQWEQVDEMFGECYTKVLDEAFANFRRWSDGR